MTKTGSLLLLVILSLPFDLSAQRRLRFGNNNTFRVEVTAKFQADLRGFSPHVTTEEEGFDVNRARFGIQGGFLRHFRYEAEYEAREAFGGRELRKPLRDAFIEFQYFDNFQLKVGKFKLPFSQEQNTGSSNLDFVLRSRLADNIAPGRDIGAMLHGRFFNRGIGYEVGVFQHDGENARPADNGPEGGTTGAARVTAMPLRLFDAPRALRDFEVAAAVTLNDAPEGLTSLRGKAYSDKTYFPHVFSNGRRLRTGLDFNWTNDPFSIKAEYVYATQSREGQSVRASDLPKSTARGWYVSGTWYALEDTLQFGARYDELLFGNAGSKSGDPSRSPRAPNIFENNDRAWTLGLNWFPNSYLKIQVNGIHEKFKDLERTPIDGREKFWMGIVRVQFAM